MKLIIAGSRTLKIAPRLIDAIICNFGIEELVDEVVSGTAGGVDTAGELWQKEMKQICGSNAPILKRFPADWETHGKSAGYKRNLEMGQYADALLLIWDGESKGSGHMRDIMKKLNKPIYEIILREEK